MYEQPSSPTSPPRHRRSLRLSSFEVPTDSSRSPYTSGTTNGTSLSRRSSRTSQTSYHIHSPTTPRLMSARSSRRSSYHERKVSAGRLSIGSNFSLDQMDSGMGNLADELEDALEDDEFEVHDGAFLDGVREDDTPFGENIVRSPDGTYHTSDLVDMRQPSSPSLVYHSRNASLQDESQLSRAEKRKSRHKRTKSKLDGSGQDPAVEQDEDGFPPSLVRRMKDIESITRMSTNSEDMLSEDGGVIKRTTNALKDLGPQASIEASVSRIVTAYTSMTSHRTHKTRDFFSQIQSLLYSSSIPDLPEEAIDILISDLDILSSTIPFLPQQNPLLALQIVATQTLDLIQSLRSLTDILQESRIQVNIASRKLKSVKDMLDDIQFERELAETSMLLIQAGDWDRRCRERQAAATCREVIEGFGDMWGLEVEGRAWMTTTTTTTATTTRMTQERVEVA